MFSLSGCTSWRGGGVRGGEVDCAGERRVSTPEAESHGASSASHGATHTLFIQTTGKLTMIARLPYNSKQSQDMPQ